MNGYREGYERGIENASTLVAAELGNEWVDRVEAEIEKLSKDLEQFIQSEKSVDTLSGDIAEYWHADTFNIDAILEGSSTHADVPRSTEFASPDIELSSGEKYQVKYYQDGEHSASAQSESYLQASHTKSTQSAAAKAIDDGADPNAPIYKDMKRLIPDGQEADAQEYLKRKMAKESAARPEQVERYADTSENLETRVSDEGGVESKPLSREESKKLAREVKEGKVALEEHGISTEQLVKFEHVVKSSLKAGVTAAAIAAALKAAPAIVDAICELVESGEVDASRLRESGFDALDAGGKGFVAGTATAAVTEVAAAGLLGEAMKELDPSAIGAAVAVAMVAVQSAIKLANGEMTERAMAVEVARSAYVAVFAVAASAAGKKVGASVGELLATEGVAALATALGFTMPPAAAIAAVAITVGCLVGSLVGSLVGGVSFEAGQNAVDSGFTFFGLVDQDYELPSDVVEQLGIDVFEYERIEPERYLPQGFRPEMLVGESGKPDRIEFSYLRRGVIDIGVVGYTRA